MSDLLDFSPLGQVTYTLAGAKARFYDAGTTTPRTVYADEAETIPHPSPLLADSNGEFAQAFVSGGAVKVVVTQADDSAGYTLDPCVKVAATGSAAASISFTPSVLRPQTTVQQAIDEGTFPARTFQAGQGISITNPDGVAGNPVVSSTAVSPGAIMHFALRAAPTGWLKANGAAVSRATYLDLFNAICPVIGNFTVTIASPGVFSLTAHGLINGDQVRLTTTGALPTGLNTTTTYFVVGSTTNTFQLSLTLGGAAINTSGSQSGTHSVRSFPYGAGDGSSTFNVPDLRGEFARGLDDGRGVDSGRVLGSAQAQAIQSHTHDVAGTASMSATFAAGTVMLSSGSGYASGAAGGTETRPRNVALLACIKF